jgi:hypothetical protein
MPAVSHMQSRRCTSITDVGVVDTRWVMITCSPLMREDFIGSV